MMILSPLRLSRRLSISAAVVVVLLLSGSVVPAGDADQLEPRLREDHMITMSDGTRLAANIFLPAEPGSYPVILMRTPYGKPGRGWDEAQRYTQEGIAMVVQDCRGRGASEGVWNPFRYDGQDGYDTQQWVGVQSWCNGKIGTAGGSYVGWTQWSSAPRQSPFLTAMAPVVPFANSFDELAFQGGAFQLALMTGWGALVAGVPLDGPQLDAALHHLPLNTIGSQFQPQVPYLNDWIQHPAYGEYWRARGIDYQYDEVTVPTLNIGGWYDIFAKTTIELIEQVRQTSHDRQARRNQFVVMGPWAHGVGVRRVGELDFGEAAAMDLGQLQRDWFAYWLQGRETGVEDWPAYLLFVMGENRWRAESAWPLERTIWTPYYFHSQGAANTRQGDGVLSTEEPRDEPADRFTYDGNDPVPTTGGNNLVGAAAGPYDQSAVEDRQDVLVYSSEPLSQDLEVTGPVKAVLYITSSAPDTDFTAKLVDVHSDGKAYNLCEGILRTRYRDGRDAPNMLQPGEPARIEIDLWVTANLFRRGHRIRVEVSSSNFPRFDRNPNSGQPPGTDTELLAASQTVLHDPQHPSHVLLPVIPR